MALNGVSGVYVNLDSNNTATQATCCRKDRSTVSGGTELLGYLNPAATSVSGRPWENRSFGKSGSGATYGAIAPPTSD